MSKSVKYIEFIDQRTLTLVIDIAALLEECDKSDPPSAGAFFVRSAINNAVLLLECVANSLLGSLGLPARLLDELDRLPTLAKLDYYLFSRCGEHIDRGCRETELAQDVLKLRDHLVHPKLKKGVVTESSKEHHVDYGQTKALAIPLDSRTWTQQQGIKVANSVIEFLRVFFLQWCAQGKGDVTRLLACRERDLLDHEVAMWVTLGPEHHRVVQKWLPNVLSFLDLRPSNNGQ